MHIVVACLFGLSVWLPLTLYTGATSGEVWVVVAMGPFIVSGAAVGLLLLDAVLNWMMDRLEGLDGAEQ